MSGSVAPITVSVVVVSWNAREYLAQCLASLSVRACRYPLEVIVVDNASTDGSAELVRKKFPHVHLICNPSNLGFAKATNIGVQRSSGNYICMINSDVKVLEDCVTRLVDYMEAEPEVGLAGPRMLDPDGKVARSCHGFPTLWNLFCVAIGLDQMLPKVRLVGGYLLRYWAFDTTQCVEVLGGWFWIVRREAVQTVGLLDEEFFFYGEDLDWCKRFQLQGLKVVYLATASSIHYGGGSSKNAPIQYAIQQQRAMFQYLRKHHSPPAQAACYGIFIIHQITRLIGHGVLLMLRPGNDQHLYKVQTSWSSLLWFLRGAT
jgi:hypothetical protein